MSSISGWQKQLQLRGIRKCGESGEEWQSVSNEKVITVARILRNYFVTSYAVVHGVVQNNHPILTPL